MKKFLLVMLIVLTGSYAYAEDYLIKKVGENNVAVIPYKLVTDINGNSVTVLDESNTTYYGRDRLNEELEIAQRQLTEAINLDAEAYKQELINEAKERIDKLNRIKEAMEK